MGKVAWCLGVIGLGLFALPAGASVPDIGEILLADRGGETGATLFSVNMAVRQIRIVNESDSLGEISAVAWGRRKHLYVAEGSRIHSVDPYDGEAANPAPFDHPLWAAIVDIIPDESGGLYVLDRESDPLSEGYHGALFAYDPDQEAATLLASGPLWSSPSRVVLEEAGTLLVLHPAGRMSEDEPLPGIGAVYRVDPDTRTTTPLFPLDFAADPRSLAIVDAEHVFIADANFTATGMPLLGGALLKISLSSFDIVDTLSVEEFGDPTDLAVSITGDLVVMDTNPNSELYPNSTGALFEIDVETGEVVGSRKVSDSRLRDLQGIEVLEGPEVSDSRFSIGQLPSAPVYPGETVAFTATLRNTGTTTTGEFTMEAQLGDFVPHLARATADGGVISHDPSRNAFRWTGVIQPYSAPMVVKVDLRVRDDAEDGELLTVAIRLTGEMVEYEQERSKQVEGRSTPQDIGVFVDSGADFPTPNTPGLFLLSPQIGRTETLFHNPDLMPKPVDVAFTADGQLYALDGTPGAGKVVRITADLNDPNPDETTGEVIYEGAPLSTPTALCPAHDGTLLIADMKGTAAYGWPNQPGIIYRLDPAQPQQLDTLFAHDFLLDPGDLCRDIEGGYVIADFGVGVERPNGRIVEIAGDGELLTARAHTIIERPSSVFVTPTGTIYYADVHWDATPRYGGIRRIARSSGPGGPGELPPFQMTDEGNSLLVEPWGIDMIEDDEILICDREAETSFTGDGMVLKLTGSGNSWSLSAKNFDTTLVNPARMAYYRPSEVVIRQFELDDLSGGFLETGDTLVARALIQNNERTPALDIAAEIGYPSGVTLLSATTEQGALFTNPDYRTVRWSGDLLFVDPNEIELRCVVSSLAPNGEVLEFTLELLGQEDPWTYTVSDTISAPFLGGEILVLDSQTGEERGIIYALAPDAGDTYMVPSVWDVGRVRPVDMIAVSDERILILDSDAEPEGHPEWQGALLELTVSTGELTEVASSELFVSPQRLLPHPEGGWLILDPEADIAYAEATGVIFRVAEDGEVIGATAARAFRALTDMTIDEDGTLWVTDRDADPEQTGQGLGAIFRLEPNEGGADYTVVDTIASEEILDPTGVLAVPLYGLLLTDPSWRNTARHTGVRAVDPLTGEISVLGTSREMAAPSQMFYLDSNRVLIIDDSASPSGGGSGAVFELDLISRTVSIAGIHRDSQLLVSLGEVARPDVRFVDFRAEEDSTGRYAMRGDTLHPELRFTNRAEMTERQAVVTIDFSDHLALTAEAPQVSAGDVAVTPTGLRWEGTVAQAETIAIRYEVVIGSTPGLTPWVDQTAEIERLDGTTIEQSLSYYLSTSIGEHELLIVDRSANPRGYPGGSGAVLRVEEPLRQVVPLLADSIFANPTAIERMPGSQTDVLVVDGDARIPDGETRGGLLRVSTISGRVERAYQDTTFREPRTLSVRDSATCYLLDEYADPYGFREGVESVGAIYEIDLDSGETRVVFSDTLMARAIDMVYRSSEALIDLLYWKPLVSGGEREYGIAQITPDTSGFSILWEGKSPLSSPRSIGLAANGNLLIADVKTGGGTIYEFTEEGGFSAMAEMPDLLSPVDIFLGEFGIPYVVDSRADPRGYLQTGTIFRLDDGDGAYPDSVYLTGPPLWYPYGASLPIEIVPVLLVAFQLSELPDGVRITWQPPGLLEQAAFYVYRRQEGEAASEYLILNPDRPIRGGGELTYVDHGVTGGKVYEYVLKAILPDGIHMEFGPQWIRIEPGAIRFGLDPVAPTPLSLSEAAQGVPFRFHIPPPSGARVRLGIYDVTGRLRHRLIDEPLDPGEHVLLWNGRDRDGAPVSSGIYFVRLEAGVRRQHRRLVLMK